MNNNLRIGIISYRSNPYCGGQGVYVRNLSKSLTDLGHRVEVISGPPDPLLYPGSLLTKLPTLDLYDPENLFRTPRISELKDPVNMMEWLGVSSMGYPEPFTFGIRAQKYLKGKEKKYDIIHDNQCLAYGMLSIAKRIPLCATIHHPVSVDRKLAVKSTRSFYKKVKHLRWYSFAGMQQFVARRLKKIITVSEFSKKDISKIFKIPENRFIPIPIGIDTQKFHPLDTVKREPGRLIVTSSSDTPLKGLYPLLVAVKKILEQKRRVSLVVIGTCKKNGGIEKLIKKLELKDHVTFTGRVEHHRFIREYAKASVAVVPSLYEGFGLPAVEAMACRTPLVCTSGGALPEVAGDAAKIVAPGDPRPLSKAITELLDNEKMRERLARKGYERVLKHFTWQATAEKTVQAYRETIDDYNRV